MLRIHIKGTPLPAAERPAWVAQRVKNFIHNLSTYEQRIRTSNLPQLFGPSPFPDADQLATMGVVVSKETFDAFIRLMNRCLVEPMEKYGASLGHESYFSDLKGEYPALIAALERIKVYRSNSMHIMSDPEIDENLSALLRDDLDGRPPSEVPELWFILQQKVLNKLFRAIDVETARLPAGTPV